jgi:hypothetical protein
MGATDKQAAMDGKDFAKAIGINKPANVRDKIKRWQQEVDPDAATKDNAGASASEPSTKPPAAAASPKPPTTPKSKPHDDKPNWKPTHERGKSVGSSPERPGSAKKTPVPHNELDEDLLTATAPKKRVISDSHWRAKLSPPKDVAGRPQPKTIPNAWVRPSRIIPKKPASPELKPIAPVTPQSNPLLPLAEYIGKSTGQKKAPLNKRRPSKPSSSENDQRPVSSGAGSGKTAKSDEAPSDPTSPQPEKEKTEMVRMRRSRRRARTSPRASMSAEDLMPFTPWTQPPGRRSGSVQSDDPRNIVTVEYAESSAPSLQESRITSPRDDELRERRRRRRPRSNGARTEDESTKPAPKPSRKKSRRSYPRTQEEAATPLIIPAAPETTTPTKATGSRLEAWLSSTPDPLAEAKPRRRRKSKESVSSPESASKVTRSDVTASTDATQEIPVKKTRSRRRRKSKDSVSSLDLPATVDASEVTTSTRTTEDEPRKKSPRRRKSKDSVASLDLPYRAEKSDVSASTDATKDEPVEKLRRRSSGSGSRRRRRRSSREMTINTQHLDETPSTVVSDATTETTTQDQESEVSVTPTPSLKRRGAKRGQYSPTKGRSMSSPLRETTSIDDMPKDDITDLDTASSVPSSFVDAPVLDAMPRPLRPRQILGPRMFPSTGKRLSTIASQSARSSQVPASDTITTISEEAGAGPGAPASEVGSYLNPETSTIISRQSTRRRKLARHEDLISVLSMPRASSKSIVSARSIRTNRSRLATATVDDIMKELSSDEAKYMRELRTLVDGVIPVLLSCVLSKSESAIAAGLFSRSSKSDPSEVTKPIVDMGICLERLKNLHKRVPLEDSDALVSWAQSAQRVYSDYIAAWRLGFQDVVISLAPADDDPFKPAKVVNGPDDGAPWDEGMPRNAEGYVVNSDGERVDVAYMLKRPLVRLKYLSKSLKVC